MRGLVSVVVILGVLIVAGVAVVGITVARRMGGPAVATPVALQEPEGTRVAAATATPDRLTLLLQGGGPDRVVILDPRTGQIVGRVGLAR